MAFKVFRNGQEPAEEWTTLYRLLDTLSKGRHTFGSATTRRSTALKPAGVYTATTAARPGEQVQMDATVLDGCRTNEHCPRGVRIKLRREDLYVLQQSEPYATMVEQLFCPECVGCGLLTAPYGCGASGAVRVALHEQHDAIRV